MRSGLAVVAHPEDTSDGGIALGSRSTWEDVIYFVNVGRALHQVLKGNNDN